MDLNLLALPSPKAWQRNDKVAPWTLREAGGFLDTGSAVLQSSNGNLNLKYDFPPKPNISWC